MGKSSFLAAFVDGEAGTEQFSTIGVDLRKKTVLVDGKSLTLEVCIFSDTLMFDFPSSNLKHDVIPCEVCEVCREASVFT